MTVSSKLSPMSERVATDIEQKIITGQLASDMTLPSERELMKQFSTSRTIIRDAIAKLASQGLLKVQPRHRPIVRRPDFDSALNAMSGVVKHLLNQNHGVERLYQLRVFCERMLVREAALKASKDDIQRLKVALQQNETCIDDSTRFYETDMAFHGTLYSIPNNPVFSSLHEAFVTWLSPKWTQMERLPERNRNNFRAHKAIYDAILERDADRAEMALIAHLDSAWRDVHDILEG